MESSFPVGLEIVAYFIGQRMLTGRKFAKGQSSDYCIEVESYSSCLLKGNVQWIRAKLGRRSINSDISLFMYWSVVMDGA